MNAFSVRFVVVPSSVFPEKTSMLSTASMVRAVVRTSADTVELMTSFSVRTSTFLPAVSVKSVPTRVSILPTFASTVPVTVAATLDWARRPAVFTFTCRSSPTVTAASSLAVTVMFVVDASKRSSTCKSILLLRVLKVSPLLVLIALPVVRFSTVPTSTFAVVPTRTAAVASKSVVRSPPVMSILLRPESATLSFAYITASVVDKFTEPMTSAVTAPANTATLSPTSTSSFVLALTLIASVSRDAVFTADTATLLPLSITSDAIVASSRLPAVAFSVSFALTDSAFVDTLAEVFELTSRASVVSVTVFPPSMLIELPALTSIVALVIRARPCAATSTPPALRTRRSCADTSNVLFTFTVTSSDVTVSWSPTDTVASLNAFSVRFVVVPSICSPANSSTLSVTFVVIEAILLPM